MPKPVQRRERPGRPRTLRLYGALVLVIAVLFGWWMIYFARQDQYLAARMAAAGVVLSPDEAAALHRAVAKTSRVLLFEGAFLGLLLLGSVALVVRALQREVQAVHQQSNFLSAVTHELRSPIASARLYLESIELGRASPEQRERYVRHAREDLDRLGTMVEDLLQSARLAKAAPTLAPVELDLGRHARAALDELEPQLAGATLDRDLTAGVRVFADPQAVRTMLRNLVSNALKYGGEPARIEVRVDASDGLGRITVRDHGPGLGELEPERAFDPFVRGGDESVRTRQGVGLGLYLVGELARASGGRARALSAAPGLAVEVLLPQARGADDPGRQPEEWAS